MKKYYEAYDMRYKRIHEDGLLWFKNAPTPELLDWISYQNIPLEETILEVGCGEGRDAFYLASNGYKVSGTDVSEEALSICKIKSNENQLNIEWNREDFIEMSNNDLPSYNWIYSIGTLHMLASLHLKRSKKKPSIWQSDFIILMTENTVWKRQAFVGRLGKNT